MWIDTNTLQIVKPNFPEFTKEFIYGHENSHPKDSYVYGHYDSNGNIFYVGKGIGKRAWSDKKRHPIWSYFVHKKLSGKYQIRIVEENLSNFDAELLEDAIMQKFADQLLNWNNWGRKTNIDLCHQLWRRKLANRRLVSISQMYEVDEELEKAVTGYYKAIEAIKDYTYIETDSGLLGKTIREEHEDVGYSGELSALNRLTICLCKLKRGKEALEACNYYFSLFKRDLSLSGAIAIQKRVAKANN